MQLSCAVASLSPSAQQASSESKVDADLGLELTHPVLWLPCQRRRCRRCCWRPRPGGCWGPRALPTLSARACCPTAAAALRLQR